MDSTYGTSLRYLLHNRLNRRFHELLGNIELKIITLNLKIIFLSTFLDPNCSWDPISCHRIRSTSASSSD